MQLVSCRGSIVPFSPPLRSSQHTGHRPRVTILELIYQRLLLCQPNRCNFLFMNVRFLSAVLLVCDRAWLCNSGCHVPDSLCLLLSWLVPAPPSRQTEKRRDEKHVDLYRRSGAFAQTQHLVVGPPTWIIQSSDPPLPRLLELVTSGLDSLRDPPRVLCFRSSS